MQSGLPAASEQPGVPSQPLQLLAACLGLLASEGAAHLQDAHSQVKSLLWGLVLSQAVQERCTACCAFKSQPAGSGTHCCCCCCCVLGYLAASS